MKSYDLIVIGGGSGLRVSHYAHAKGLKVAVVEKGPLGGTCLNRGCIPSKIIIHNADVVEQIKRSKELGITSKISKIDFSKITSRASKIVDGDARSIERGINGAKGMDLYKAKARFIDPHTLQVGNEKIKGKKVVIAAGTRPSIPPIPGLNTVPFLTSTEALRLNKQPKHLVCIGGGYISTELAHFYGALGTKITIIQRNDVLIPNADREIAEVFTKEFSKKYKILLNHDAAEIHKKGKNIIVKAKGKRKTTAISCDAILLAVGRRSNADTLNLDAAGVKYNKFNYIKANQYMQTSQKHIYVLGDIAGNYLFKHSANHEADIVVQNAVYNKKIKVNYRAMPHAVFSSPQIAGVGETEEQLKARKANYVKGVYNYINSGMGTALNDKAGFCKILADKKTKKILGCFIIGTDASTLIHEVILAMRNNLKVDTLVETIHIHPSLSEVVQRAAMKIYSPY